MSRADLTNFRPETPTDFYCGVVPIEASPFGMPVIAELEIERGSYVIANVYITPSLPGLHRYLLRRLRGSPVTETLLLEPRAPEGSYFSDYWRSFYIALVFARQTFYEERTVEYLQALRASSSASDVERLTA